MSIQIDTDLEAMFPIGALSDKTGVKTVTLRAWERRYGLLKPKRTPKGHRLFTQKDVDRVKQVLELLEQGIPVNRVREILDNNAQVHQLKAVSSESKAIDEDPWRHFNVQFRQWIEKLDSRSLEREFNEVTSLYSLDIVARKLILPLYDTLQQQSLLFSALSADQAFFHEFLAARLGAGYLRNNTNLPRVHRSLMFFTGSNPKDTIKTLLLANVIHVHGYEVNLVGPLATVDSLPLLVQRITADAIVIMDRDIEIEKVKVLIHGKGFPFFIDTNVKVDNEIISGVNWLEHDLTKASDQINSTLTT